MIANAPVIARANVRIETFDVATGAKLSEQRRSNMAVDAGLDLLRDLLFGDSPEVITHFAVGTDATATSASDTALGAEVFRDVIATKIKGSQEIAIQSVLGSTQANGNTLEEAGLFNDASAGTMYARVTISPVSKTALISVLITWTLSFASS